MTATNAVGTSAPSAASSAFKPAATISVGTDPRGVGVNPTTNTVYVTNSQGSTVSVINGATNAVTATISVGSFPDGVGVNASTNTVYVANLGSFGTVSVMNGA